MILFVNVFVANFLKSGAIDMWSFRVTLRTGPWIFLSAECLVILQISARDVMGLDWPVY